MRGMGSESYWGMLISGPICGGRACVAEAVPAGLKHRRAPLLNREVREADDAQRNLPAESEICGKPLRRRKNRGFRYSTSAPSNFTEESRVLHLFILIFTF